MAMLGAQCSGCCECNCSAAGSAPAVPSDADRGLVWLEFSSCIGSGAAATVDAPAAASPCDYEGMAGPISGVTLTSGGSGYARLGRVAPTITASVSGGAGASLSVTLSEQSEYLGDGCMEVPWWAVGSVSVTAGGSGYSDDTAVTFSAASGDTTVHAAAGRAYVEIAEPEEAFDIDSTGSGAVLEAVWSALSEPDWADVRTPNPCPAPKKRTYRLDSVTVTSGGSGYAQYDRIYISFAADDDGSVVNQAYIDVESVDGSGAIQSVFVSPDNGLYIPGPAGKYVGSLTDELAHVVVNSCVANGAGQYYREDANEPPYVAAVTVTVNQEEPSTGSGAVITATVDDDTASADFGKVIALSLDSGGTGYLKAPEACVLPDTLYVQWNDNSLEVPIRIGANNLLVCDNNYPADGINCRKNDLPYAESQIFGIGTTSGSIAYGQVTGISCKCGGKLHMSLAISFACGECIGVRTPGPSDIVSLDDEWQGQGRDNFSTSRYACARFEVDEDGCPVGDAVVFNWSETPREASPGSCVTFYGPLGNDPANISNFDNFETYSRSPESCPCDEVCDEAFSPTISLMP